jgi:hypothetical protein
LASIAGVAKCPVEKVAGVLHADSLRALVVHVLASAIMYGQGSRNVLDADLDAACNESQVVSIHDLGHILLTVDP